MGELNSLYQENQRLREELSARESDLANEQAKCKVYQRQADSLIGQIAHNKAILELQSPRYVIGTSLYDIIRYPLHSKESIKRIIRYIKEAREDALRRKAKAKEAQPDNTPDSADRSVGRREEAGAEARAEARTTARADARATARASARTAARAEGKTVWILKCPAPEKGKVVWGDYHFCVSLADALTKLGQYAEIQMFEEWYDPVDADVVLVLRGMHRYSPSRDSKAIHVLWNISHPEAVSDKEYNSYDLVFVASRHYADTLKHRLRVPVYPLLQCTDTSRFYVTEEDKNIDRKGVLFIGSGRDEGRECVNWAADYCDSFRLYGENWGRFLVNAKEYLVAETIDNEEIREEYVHARATINDHWASMKAYQFVNNRVFDALACGLPVISDCFEELTELFPEGILYYDDEFSFRECIRRLDTDYDEIKKTVDGLGGRIRKEFSFEARADALISAVSSYKKSAEENEAAGPGRQDDRDAWDVVVVCGPDDGGKSGSRQDLGLNLLAKDPRIHRIIVFGSPIHRDELSRCQNAAAGDPDSKERYGRALAEEEFGRSISDKIVRYNYIIPRGQSLSEQDYRNYMKYVTRKEMLGMKKLLLRVCPGVDKAEWFTDELDFDLLETK